MSIKECLYREIKYGLCAGALSGLVSSSHIKLDMRTGVDRTEANYPYIVFRRVTESEDNQVSYTRDRFEIEIIGLRSSATKGDALLEQIKDIIKDHFQGKHKTFGNFDADGNPATGLRLRCQYIDTVEGFDETLEEKVHIMQFAFSRVR